MRSFFIIFLIYIHFCFDFVYVCLHSFRFSTVYKPTSSFETEAQRASLATQNITVQAKARSTDPCIGSPKQRINGKRSEFIICLSLSPILTNHQPGFIAKRNFSATYYRQHFLCQPKFIANYTSCQLQFIAALD